MEQYQTYHAQSSHPPREWSLSPCRRHYRHLCWHMDASTVRFNVVERLTTQVIIAWDYCYKHVESIRTRQRLFELANGTVVPIIRKPSPRHKDAIYLPGEHKYVTARRRSRNKISVLAPTVLQPEAQTWVTLSTHRLGIITVEPH